MLNKIVATIFSEFNDNTPSKDEIIVLMAYYASLSANNPHLQRINNMIVENDTNCKQSYLTKLGL